MKLSIITVNLNNKKGLCKTIESVTKQIWQDFEHIIIDGYSTDGSVNIIKTYEQNYSNSQGDLYWVSEPDSGIYNAMNKGIKAAHGQYCLFLNSGDWLSNKNALQNLFNYSFNENIVYTNCYFFKKENIPLKKEIFPNEKELTFDFFIQDMICHQAILFKTSFFKIYNYYDESYKLASDFKLLLSSIVYGKVTLKKIETFLTVYDQNGQTAYNRKLFEKEKREIMQKDFAFFYADYKKYESIKMELNAIRRMPIIKLAKRIRNIIQYK